MPVYPSFDADLSTIDANVDLILVDTDELQTDWTDGGRLDLLIDGIKSSTDNLPADPADASDIASAFSTTDGLITTVDTVVDAIKLSTDNLPVDPADASDITAAFAVTDGLVTTVDTVVDGIQTDLDNATDGLGALKALIDTVDTVADAIKASTDNLPVDPADASDIAAAFAVTDGLVTTVDTVVDAIKLKTDNLPVDPADASVIAAAFAVTDGLVTTVDTVVDGIVTDIGDPSGDNLASISAKFGDDPDTVKTRFDDLDTAVAGLGSGVSGESKGTFSYLDAGGEQAVVELTITDRKILYGAWLDMTTLTQSGTVKVYYKVDGATYREILSEAWSTSDSDGVFISLMMGATDDFKITYEEDADEGAARAIPYSLVWSEIQ